MVEEFPETGMDKGLRKSKFGIAVLSPNYIAGGTKVIPLKIETLLEGKVVERNRVEYKKGWNPEDIIHTICAFANDYVNVNGGYIVIGVEAEEGIPILPPCGVEKEMVDSIQQEIFQYCNQIEPRYIPIIEVEHFPNEDTHLIYLKCSPGDAGPYRAPKDVYSKKGEKKADKSMYYWIRPSSLTTIAKQGEIAELFEKFNAIPYDDRVNRRAKLDVIRRGYLEDFLRDSNSSLVDEMNNRSLEDLLLSLEVANETDTGIELKNIAVLMFAERPDKLIPGAQINLIQFNSVDAEAGDDFIEKTFTGPIWKQVNDVLDYIKTNVIVSKVNKIRNEQKADSYYNYPYNALEEAIVNAVFHKSYREDSPVEIRIYVDRIMIINFPGPDKWINMDKFAKGQIRARKYRNRRIGELFKEINLSEKQGTGIPKILRELKVNGSPIPVFETDEDRTYLETTIPEHKGFTKDLKRSQKGAKKEPKKGAERERAVVELLIQNPKATQLEMAEKLELTRKQIQNVMKGLQEDGIIEREGSNRNGKWIVNKYV